jgi:hypothetical protein
MPAVPRNDPAVLYLVISGAPAPEGLAALVKLCQSLATLRQMGIQVIFNPDAPHVRRMPSWRDVVAALPTAAGA